MKVNTLAEKIGGTLDGDSQVEIRGVASIDAAEPGDVSFVANPRYAPQAAGTAASALIVPESWDSQSDAALIRTANPDAAFAKATVLFYTPPPAPPPGIHPAACVDDSAVLGDNVSIGPCCVVEANVEIGAGTVVHGGCHIGFGSRIGADCLLYPQVSLREYVTIGARCIFHNGVVLGSDGFGYSVDHSGVRTKIQQIGTLEIGNDVEIGANSTVDRARFGKTRIGNGVKIDNLVQIAHNVDIGDHVVIVAQVGIAGSSSIGEKTILAGQAGVAGHIRVGSGAIVGPRAGVTKDLDDEAYVMGMPAVPVMKMKRSHAALMLLPKMKARIAELENRLAKLESK